MNKAEKVVLKAIKELNKKNGELSQDEMDITELAHKKGISYKKCFAAVASLTKKCEILPMKFYYQIPERINKK